MMKRSLVAVASAALLCLPLAACGGSDDTASDSGSGSGASSGASSSLDLVKSGTLTVCSDVPYAPFEDFDKSSATGFKGFDVDIVSQIAKGLGLKLVISDQDFDGLQSGLTLNAGTCDLVASALTITDDRKKNLEFSEGYYDSEQSLLVPDGSSITSIDDLDGKKVGVQQGTTGKDYATEHASGASIVSFPSDAEEFSALKAGQVDALLQDLPVNLTHQQAGGYQIVQKFDTNEEYGLAAKKGNTALIDAVDEQLDAMKSDGTYKKLYNTYFKVS
ncbi:MAG: ABC transporter substrate-binding protein [Nocardioides sp.]|uniref:ABC transporter substrate-binding protein n=1 Tax=Nocardioides sp. TaxID=35761 RepID=UPI0039E2F9AC